MHSPDIYKFCPRCAAPLELRLQAGEKRLSCPACGWVHYEDPKVAAGALVLRGREVLLVRRVLYPYTGQWSIPAGFVNAYEDPAAAAVRECREETGLVVSVDGLFEILTGREHSRGSDIFLVYSAHVLHGKLAAADDADQVGWFSLDALPPLAFSSTLKIFEKLNSQPLS